jgi:signal transduction histidine kinase
MAVEAAGLIERLLRGEDIRQMPIRVIPFVPMVNWKALDRWGLHEDRLPPGTIIMYKEPSVWSRYKWHILTAISLCVLQTGLIVALVVHRANRRQAEKKMMESKRLLQSTIDALSARVALLDEGGTIVAVNRPWKSFAEAHRYGGNSNGAGYNYLEASESDCQNEETRLVSDGIRRLISGEVEDFRRVYPSALAEGTFWFQVRVSRFEMYGVQRLVVTHEDVTEIKQAHDAQQQLASLLMRAQDEERRRIARDLHDVTVQNVVAIRADLTGIEKRAQDLEPVAAEMLQESASLCDQVIKELRTLSYLLHPPFLDEAGLVRALQWFVRGFIQRSGIQVELLVMEEIGRLPTEVETALFRVVQESLTNIHRHSGSGRAVIWVNREQDTVILKISDEGHGFSLPSAADNQERALSPGVGILGMRQRLKQLGGQLEIETSSQGTTVNIRVSISEDHDLAYLGSR